MAYSALRPEEGQRQQLRQDISTVVERLMHILRVPTCNVIDTLKTQNKLNALVSTTVTKLNENGVLTSWQIFGFLPRFLTHTYARFHITPEFVHKIVTNMVNFFDRDNIMAVLGVASDDDENNLFEFVGSAMELTILTAATFKKPSDFIFLVNNADLQLLLPYFKERIQTLALKVKNAPKPVLETLLPCGHNGLILFINKYFTYNVSDNTFNTLIRSVLDQTFTVDENSTAVSLLVRDPQFPTIWTHSDQQRRELAKALSNIIVALKPIIKEALSSQLTSVNLASLLSSYVATFPPLPFAYPMQRLFARGLCQKKVIESIAQHILDLMSPDSLCEHIFSSLSNDNILEFAALLELGVGFSMASKLGCDYYTDEMTPFRAYWSVATAFSWFKDFLSHHRTSIIDKIASIVGRGPGLISKVVRWGLLIGLKEKLLINHIDKIRFDFLCAVNYHLALFYNKLGECSKKLSGVIERQSVVKNNMVQSLIASFTQLYNAACTLSLNLPGLCLKLEKLLSEVDQYSDDEPLRNLLNKDVDKIKELQLVTAKVVTNQPKVIDIINSGDLKRYQYLLVTLKDYKLKVESYLRYKEGYLLAQQFRFTRWQFFWIMLFVRDTGRYVQILENRFNECYKLELVKLGVAQELLLLAEGVVRSVDNMVSPKYSGFLDPSEVNDKLKQFSEGALYKINDLPGAGCFFFWSRSSLAKDTERCVMKFKLGGVRPG